MNPVLRAAPMAMATRPMTAMAAGPTLPVRGLDDERDGRDVRMTLLPGARRGLALAVACMMAACGGDDEPTPPPGPGGTVATVTVSADSVRLVAGGTAQLSVQVK